MAFPDPNEFRQTVGLLPSGVTVISADQPDGPAGATASAVCSLSLEPMMMLACLDRGSRSLAAVRDADRFGISVLGEEQRGAARLFATKSTQAEKWDSVAWHTELGAPIIDGSLAWVVCRLSDVIPGGDHVIVTGEVLEVEADDDPGEPLIYHGGLFRRLDAGTEPGAP